MPKPIIDGAEVSIDFPDKAYYGIFRRGAVFSVDREEDGVAVKIVQPGDHKRVAAFHIHHYLLADIVEEIAHEMKKKPTLDEAHRSELVKAAKALVAALEPKKKR